MVRARKFVNRHKPFQKYPLHRSENALSGIFKRCGHGLVIIFIVTFFSLTARRERDMDFHHSKKNATIASKLDNGWIPNEDIIKYMSSTEKDDSLIDHSKEQLKEYVPSLQSYPLNLLQNFTKDISTADAIVYFHIPKAYGTSTKNIMTDCFHLTRASQNSKESINEYINHVLNTDTSTVVGIARAKSLGIVEKDMVDVIISSHFHEVCTLLTEEHRGRLFVLMRDPVETAISLFHYLRFAHWERTYREDFQNMTLLEYATLEDEDQNVRIDNWITRYLARKLKGPLTDDDLQLAKDILSQKALIGLTDYFEESMKRFDTYFGLHRLKHNDVKQCLSNHTKLRANANRHEKYSFDSEEWKALASRNSIDVQLYEFAKGLYHQQEAFIASIDLEKRRWNFRHPW